LLECDGAAATTFTNTACSLPLSVLTSDPYNLIQGQIVVAKIIATNFYGNSTESLNGDGGEEARIVLVPAAPFGLVNQDQITNAFQVSFTWLEGLNNGGKVVDFYEISYD